MPLNVIGESGGTKTDWVILDGNNVINKFTTGSYHPKFWNKQFVDSEKMFWQSKFPQQQLHLCFFGSGCLNEAAQFRGETLFQEIGFISSNVQSDIDAAFLAGNGNSDGEIIILGTGSVLAIKFEGKISIKGGHGYLLNEVGSGNAFGKLFLGKYLDSDFNEVLLTNIETLIGTKEVVKNKIYMENQLAFISDMARIFSLGYNSETDEIHRLNIASFFNLYHSFLPANGKIVICGSYAWHNKELINNIFNQKMDNSVVILEKPLNSIIEKLERKEISLF